MEVVVIGRHTKVSDEFQSKVVDKLRRIEALDHRATKIEAHVVHERAAKAPDERERVELTMFGRGPVIRAEASAEDRNVAFDLALDRLVDRLRKQHERRANRHRGRVGSGEFAAAVAELAYADAISSVETWDGAPETATREIPLDGTPIVIRSKTHAAAPMSIAEALDQMELVGHDFFLFHDAETGLASAVYRRRGWTYGVIHLERDDAARHESDEPAGGLRATA